MSNARQIDFHENAQTRVFSSFHHKNDLSGSEYYAVKKADGSIIIHPMRDPGYLKKCIEDPDIKLFTNPFLARDFGHAAVVGYKRLIDEEIANV